MTPEAVQYLKKIKELLDAGVLSQEEFDAEKAKILDGEAVPQKEEIEQEIDTGNYPTEEAPKFNDDEPIPTYMELYKGELVLSKLKITYGIYPSVVSFLYLTNKRIVIKSIPTVLIQPLAFMFRSPSLYSKTKADIPLSSITDIKIQVVKSSIIDGEKTHHLFKLIPGTSGLDDAMRKAASLIKEQSGKDVLTK